MVQDFLLYYMVQDVNAFDLVRLMAGKKSFEEGKALDQALIAFWHSGYEGTSYSDLETATGLKKSSLYNAFGDKAALYQKCIERFEQSYQSAMRDGLTGPNLRQVLVAYFDELFAHFSDTTIPCGSLATMEALAGSKNNTRKEAFIKTQLDKLMVLLDERFAQAVRDKELPKNTDTAALTALFFVVSRGLGNLHKNDEDIRVMRNALKAAMTILDNPPLRSKRIPTGNHVGFSDEGSA